MNKNQIWPLIILVLIVIGILYNPRPLLIPAIVIGIVALLYFFPPNRWRSMLNKWTTKGSGPANSSRQDREFERRRRKAKFRVIKGNKPDNSDDPPTYH